MSAAWQAARRRHVRQVERLAFATDKLVHNVMAKVQKLIPTDLTERNLRAFASNLKVLTAGLGEQLAKLIKKLLTHLGRGVSDDVLSLARKQIRTTPKLRKILRQESHQVHEDSFIDLIRQVLAAPSLTTLRRLVGVAPSRMTKAASPQRVTSVITQAIVNGWDRKKIGQELMGQFGVIASAARRIARTEGLRVASESQLAVSEQLQDMVIGYKINAVHKDAGSRPEHLKRSGTIYYRNPGKGQKGMDEMPIPPLESNGTVSYNCLLPGTIVEGCFTAGFQAWYSGQAVELLCRNGSRINVTANHPVLTSNGFAAACEVKIGDNLLTYKAHIKTVAATQREQDTPATVEQVFSSLSQFAGKVFTAPTSREEFHSDAARFLDGNVNVVVLESQLGNRKDITASQFDDQVFLVGGGVNGVSLPSSSPLLLDVNGVDLTAPGFMGSGDLLLSDGFAHPAPLDCLRVGLAAKLDASRKKQTSQAEWISLACSSFTAAGDAKLISELFERFPGEITLDDVVEVRHYEFAGHVYDFSSEVGYYAARSEVYTGNVLVSNCRCFLTPVFKGME